MQVHTQSPSIDSSLVELYTIDCTRLGGSIYRFTPEFAEGGSISFGGQVFQSLPIMSDGWEVSSSGTQPRPTLTVSNVSKVLHAAVVSMGDIVGARVTRLRTMKKFLDAASFPRRNICNYSEQFDLWNRSTGGTGVLPTVTANNALSPIDTLTADRIVFDKGAGTTSTDQSTITMSSIASVIGQPYAGSVWLKSADGSTYTVRLDFSGTTPNSGSTLAVVTAEWQRFTIILNSAADTSRRITIRLRGGQGTSNYASVHAWGAQQEIALPHPTTQQYVASEYQRTTTTHQPDANPNAYLRPEVFEIEQKINHTGDIIQWQLSSFLDRFGTKLPRRQITRDKFPGVGRQRGSW